ncbi:DoxX family membrane protein [Hymenobacter sp. GOD-10R]|uniref:DoxX family membrane protein n=1 Tax=Hymenobacter sp. GOD-10R TaxID=3093922 RepID=UPI002D77F20A|nr:DoxX family membrane protein [Hymenobacter sp. GOD-10R]WRQ29977.1 DoxX family membrane protein [Hymenobacter sp. GOD-10R]
MKLTNSELAFVLGRLLLGINFLGHGLVRIPKLGAFRAGLVKQFAATWLPSVLVELFATVLPFVEFGIGLLLLLGLFTRPVLALGMFVLMALVFGSSQQENWDAVGTQMIYGIFFLLLLRHAEHNRYCLDARPSS